MRICSWFCGICLCHKYPYLGVGARNRAILGPIPEPVQAGVRVYLAYLGPQIGVYGLGPDIGKSPVFSPILAYMGLYSGK